MNHRLRPIAYAVAALAGVWLLAWAGFSLAQKWRMTADKVAHYVDSVDLSKLSGDERARALQKLADMINALSSDERRHWRMEGGWKNWFAQMTEEERGKFIDATLPTGFKQMMDAFAELPDAKRKKVVDDAIKNLREARDDGSAGPSGPRTADYGTNGPPPLSPELEQKVRSLGLKAYYSQSSAETKAELAPLVEEIQNQIRNGRGFH
jgi:peptidoglycan/xylan/chitin deacetylase (PgdA/CDA1 family)